MQNQNQTLSAQPTSWFQKVQIVRAVSWLPALIVALCIRRRIGFRFVKPWWLFGVSGLLLASAIFVPDVFDSHGWFTGLLAVAVSATGLCHRRNRWRDLCNGVRWHSRSSGVSYFEGIRLPDFLRRNRRIYRWLDPIVCLLVGLVLGLLLSKLLGFWICFSALALAVFEQSLFERELDRALDNIDGLIAAEVDAEIVKSFEGRPDYIPQTVEQTCGIPCGIAPDIQKQIASSKEFGNRQQRDNLVAV